MITLSITITPFLGYYLLSGTPLIEKTSFSKKTYGLQKHEILFDEGNLTTLEANQIADALIQTTFFDDDEDRQHVYVKKENNTYELFIAVIKGVENDPQALRSLTEFRDELQTFFTDKKIVLQLVYDSMNNVVKIIY